MDLSLVLRTGTQSSIFCRFVDTAVCILLLLLILILLSFTQVIWKYFYSKKSAKEHGTMYQLRNLLHRTNVVSKPAKDFNACDDFFNLIVTSHILTASLEVFHMNSLHDTPSLDAVPALQDALSQTKDCRKKILISVCKAVIDKFVSFQFHCQRSPTGDQVHAYSMQLLSVGCFYLEFSDAIREGDGDRVVRCWRYLLAAFKSSGRKNYSIESLNMLCQHLYVLTPRQSAELLWSRFVNVHGRPGRNIPLDLHQEHLNRVCKDAIQGLGMNKSEKAITRVGKAMGTLFPILCHFDEDNAVHNYSGTHSPPSSEKDINMIIHQLQQSKAFTNIPGRKHRTFPNPRDVLHSKDHSELIDWMKKHL